MLFRSTVILHPSGEVIGKLEGYTDAGSFRTFLDQTASRSGWADRLAQLSSRSEDPSRGRAEVSGEEVALAGYCPVTLVKDRRLVEGLTSLTVRYQGQAFRFADPSRREAFLKEPEAFLPANRGRCPVRQVDHGESIPGDPHFGVLFCGRLFICSDGPARDLFLNAPGRYSEADVADHGFCPHCRYESGLLVRGLPRYNSTHRGVRYYFPDPKHLDAFRTDPEKYIR